MPLVATSRQFERSDEITLAHVGLLTPQRKPTGRLAPTRCSIRLSDACAWWSRPGWGATGYDHRAHSLAETEPNRSHVLGVPPLAQASL